MNDFAILSEMLDSSEEKAGNKVDATNQKYNVQLLMQI